jgi:molybdenum cofactor cytidylyltransferase
VPFVTGLILAAGGSSRLGAPKQLLPYGNDTLLDHVLNTARACEFDQLVCVIGGVADEIRERVDLKNVEVVENRHFGEGCSSSIATALTAVDQRAEVLVLMLGDQPGVTPHTVKTLLAGRNHAPLAACAYEDGRGHPLAFARSTFGELQALHGDKGVWKLLDRAGDQVVDVPVPGAIPRDVDTDEDYRAVIAEAAQLVASELGVPALDVKVVPADADRFGTGHGYNTAPSVQTATAIQSATGKIRAKAQLLAAAAMNTEPESLTWQDGAFVSSTDPSQAKTIADVALYAHGTGQLPPGVEGGLDAQTVYKDA